MVDEDLNQSGKSSSRHATAGTSVLTTSTAELWVGRKIFVIVRGKIGMSRNVVRRTGFGVKMHVETVYNRKGCGGRGRQSGNLRTSGEEEEVGFRRCATGKGCLAIYLSREDESLTESQRDELVRTCLVGGSNPEK